MTTSIMVAGLSKLYVALPDSYSTLRLLGVQQNETRIETQMFQHPVHSDEHGGPSGPPVEEQVLGKIMRCTFQLSKWDADVRTAIENHGVFGTTGAVADDEVGSLLYRDNSFRVLVKPSRNNTALVAGNDDPFLYNFICCKLSSPIAAGQGTKHSILQFTMEAHRAPAGHYGGTNVVGKIFDKDETGIPV